MPNEYRDAIAHTTLVPRDYVPALVHEPQSARSLYVETSKRQAAARGRAVKMRARTLAARTGRSVATVGRNIDRLARASVTFHDYEVRSRADAIGAHVRRPAPTVRGRTVARLYVAEPTITPGGRNGARLVRVVRKVKGRRLRSQRIPDEILALPGHAAAFALHVMAQMRRIGWWGVDIDLEVFRVEQQISIATAQRAANACVEAGIFDRQSNPNRRAGGGHSTYRLGAHAPAYWQYQARRASIRTLNGNMSNTTKAQSTIKSDNAISSPVPDGTLDLPTSDLHYVSDRQVLVPSTPLRLARPDAPGSESDAFLMRQVDDPAWFTSCAPSGSACSCTSGAGRLAARAEARQFRDYAPALRLRLVQLRRYMVPELAQFLLQRHTFEHVDKALGIARRVASGYFDSNYGAAWWDVTTNAATRRARLAVQKGTATRNDVQRARHRMRRVHLVPGALNARYWRAKAVQVGLWSMLRHLNRTEAR